MKRVSPLCFLAISAAAVSFPAIAQEQPLSIPSKDFGPLWTGFCVGAAFGAGGVVNQINILGLPTNNARAEE